GDEAMLDRAATALDTGSRDEQGLALEVPSDGGVRSLRALLDRLDAASIEVDALSVRSADLDDVFLSLTGRSDGAEAPHAASPAGASPPAATPNTPETLAPKE